LENVLSNNTSSEKEIEKKMCDRCNENKDREKNEMFNTVDVKNNGLFEY
jgi:hypothetical protein